MGNGNTKYTYQGLPYMGDQMLFRKADPKHLKPELTADGSCDIFELWKPEQLSEFNMLLSDVAKGEKHIYQSDKQWIDEHKNWKVIVIWVRPYYTDPTGYRKELNDLWPPT